MKEKKKQLIVVALAFALLLLIGGTYAYFSINASNDKTGAKVAGKANNLGNPTMQIKTSKLYLNLDANLMSQANAGKTYYANENESGLALETNPNYTLATASLPVGDEALDCTYNYKVTATITTPITDNSDNDVKVIVGDKTMTLKELTTAGTTGIIVSGEIKNLTKGNSVSIPLTSSVTNTSNTQDKLVGNSYTIKIEPYTNGDTKAFSCKLHADSTSLADQLIASGNLWQSNLEGDGYRYVGLGNNMCSYDSGKYYASADSDGNCPVAYGGLFFVNNNGPLGYKYTSDSSDCSNNIGGHLRNCTQYSGEKVSSANINNFICFGTTDKVACTKNQDKYMYRVLGVFSDANGENHVKLIKYKQLVSTTWNSSNADVNWGDSTLYASLNGSGFLTNTTYDYLQNTEWSNRIENWTWSAVNTKTYEDKTNNPDYYRSSPTGIFLNDMHKTSTGTLCTNYNSGATNCNGRVWTNPKAKIGLMYASDYALSLGSSALALTTGTGANDALLKAGWMHQSNNDTTKSQYEWTLSRYGAYVSNFSAWTVNSAGFVDYGYVNSSRGVRPVFYLTSNQVLSSGDGSLENPFIIAE